jgi:hypothetical protein
MRTPTPGPRYANQAVDQQFARYRSCLARAQARTAPDDDLLAMRRAAWRTQGAVVPEDVRDDWTRQALINEANRLYGRRPGGAR